MKVGYAFVDKFGRISKGANVRAMKHLDHNLLYCLDISSLKLLAKVLNVFEAAH